ncbi:MAG TPA: type I restriction-modification enzyme R subunit C-terminal domain-containing protein, partial [Burkholderiaceae bacterium]|nr:type I restriction-modification enzyme R subunit C-terminal domain-containing protein [Burkholderiaceae bacterium]
LHDYTRINVMRQYDSLDKFLQAWNGADRKAALIEALEAEGVLFEALADEIGKDLDPFDLLLHVAYNMPPLTRRERANRVKKRNAFAKYGETARRVIEALIDKYADEGVQTIESMEVLRVPPLDTLGTPMELVKSFGGRAQYDAAVRSLEQELYRPEP